MKSFTPLILIAVSVALFFFHIDPRYEAVQGLQEQQDQYEQALVRAQELQTVRDQLLSRYDSFSQDDIARLERIVPDRINVVKLVADIDGVAAKYGIAVADIQVTDDTVDNSNEVVSAESAMPFMTTEIELTFNASYENLVSFLTDLETSLQVVDIVSIAFTPASGGATGPQTGIYEYTIALHAYWLRP